MTEDLDIKVLGQSLVAGWLTDQVNARSEVPKWIGWVVCGLGLLLAFLLNGWWRSIGFITLAVGLFGLFCIWAVKALSTRLIRRFAEPANAADYRDDVQAALDKADLPTAPLAIVRFLTRLRKGAGPEVARLKSVLLELQSSISDAA